jgi:uridine phosphorylase
MPPPILRTKRHDAPSVFQAENLLREARRQKGLATADVPAVNLLDPDGDILRYLRETGQARPLAAWACYHSQMFEFERAGQRIGIIGNAVGAPYAVLLAEQMFASGCRLLISITSSGQLKPLGETPYYVLAEQAYRDEGTSYHYLPPADFATADPDLIAAAWAALADSGLTVHKGRTWTTDAPYRETQAVIEEGRALGLAAIEMESAALYAFAAAKAHPVLCFAHVTNTMAVTEVDFEKGDAQGALDSLRLLDALLSGGLDNLLR